MSGDTNPLAEVAAWLVEVGYPFDFRTDPVPPERLRRAVEDAWVAKDATTAQEAEWIKETVAEEGGWDG